MNEALLKAKAALSLAASANMVVLTSHPPQPAWQAWRVDEAIQEAIKLIDKAMETAPKQTFKLFDDWWLEEGRDYYLSNAYTGKQLALLAWRGAKE